jgi:DNA topoisomerase IA
MKLAEELYQAGFISYPRQAAIAALRGIAQTD